MRKDIKEHSKKQKQKAVWNDSRDGYLILELLCQQRQGKRSDNGWKKEAWRETTDKFNAHFKVTYNCNQLKSRMQLVSN